MAKERGYYELDMNARFTPEMMSCALVGNVINNGLHWHRHLEVMCCVRGSFCIRAEQSVVRLYPGDFFTIHCNVPHEIFDGEPDGLQIIFSADEQILRCSPGERYCFATVGENAVDPHGDEAGKFRKSVAALAAMLTPEISMENNAPFPGGRGKNSRAFPENDWESSFFTREKQWYAYQMETYACLMCLAGHKISGSADEGKSGSFDQFRACVELIRENYTGPLDAAVLASALKVSQPTIYRLFRKNLGVSVNDYIRLVRVRAACALLENTDREITEIAFSCGFTSLSNFYRIFHEEMHQTPTEYRKMKKQTYRGNIFQRQVMDLNQFQSFCELPYTKQDILNYGDIG